MIVFARLLFMQKQPTNTHIAPVRAYTHTLKSSRYASSQSSRSNRPFRERSKRTNCKTKQVIVYGCIAGFSVQSHRNSATSSTRSELHHFSSSIFFGLVWLCLVACSTCNNNTKKAIGKRKTIANNFRNLK